MKTKKEIAKEVAEALDISQTLARKAVQATLDSIVDGLVADGRIELRKFGVFEIRQRAEKQTRHPKTGEPVTVPVKKVVTFKSGTEMDQRVQRLFAKTLSQDRAEGLERERLAEVHERERSNEGLERERSDKENNNQKSDQ